MITFSKFLATIKIDVLSNLKWILLSAKKQTKIHFAAFSKNWEFRTLIDRVLKKKFPEME